MKDKALEYIEKLCLVYENSNKRDIKNVNKIMGSIYRFSHIANDRCENKHLNWRKELREQDWEI